MDDLPPHLIVEILSRIDDSADLARCRLASKTLNSLSGGVRSLNLTCTLCRYFNSRSPETKDLLTPFKSIFNSLVLRSWRLDSVSVGVDKALGEISFDDVEDESDDLYLSDVVFVKEWLPRVCGELKSLSISDFWIQSCWRTSEVLGLISSHCVSLQKLELKNTCLSVERLTQMCMLTHLTLEHIRLNDKDLNQVNECFPYLQVLNLVEVGGFETPKIHLLHLKTCLWTVSNYPQSLTIIAPNLAKLDLTCIRPKSLVLDTPLLSDLHLSFEKVDEFKANDFHHLKNLHLQSHNLHGLLAIFPSSESVKMLMVESLVKTDSAGESGTTGFGLESLFDLFPNMWSLNLGPRAWAKAEICFRTRGLAGKSAIQSLKEIVVHLVVSDIDTTLSFIYSIVDKCTKLSDMAILLPYGEGSSASSSLISRCAVDHPRIRWKWGMWKEGSKDTWIS